jgi:ribosome-binding protein aMBF1 (putative translation factor)
MGANEVKDMNESITPEPVEEIEVEIELDDSEDVAPSKTASKKPATKKDAAKAKPKEKKPKKPLTLHKNYLIDIRRHRGHLGIDESNFGDQLIVKETVMTVAGKKLKAITIAIVQ